MTQSRELRIFSEQLSLQYTHAKRLWLRLLIKPCVSALGRCWCSNSSWVICCHVLCGGPSTAVIFVWLHSDIDEVLCCASDCGFIVCCYKINMFWWCCCCQIPTNSFIDVIITWVLNQRRLQLLFSCCHCRMLNTLYGRYHHDVISLTGKHWRLRPMRCQ